VFITSQAQHGILLGVKSTMGVRKFNVRGSQVKKGGGDLFEPATYIQGVSGGIVNILGSGSMDYSE